MYCNLWHRYWYLCVCAGAKVVWNLLTKLGWLLMVPGVEVVLGILGQFISIYIILAHLCASLCISAHLWLKEGPSYPEWHISCLQSASVLQRPLGCCRHDNALQAGTPEPATTYKSAKMKMWWWYDEMMMRWWDDGYGTMKQKRLRSSQFQNLSMRDKHRRQLTVFESVSIISERPSFPSMWRTSTMLSYPTLSRIGATAK